MTKRSRTKTAKARKASIPMQYWRRSYQQPQSRNNVRTLLLIGLVLALVVLLLAQNGWLDNLYL